MIDPSQLDKTIARRCHLIDPKIKEACAFYKTWPSDPGRVIVNAYLDAEAGRRMAEFQLDHRETDIGHEQKEWCDVCDCSRFSGNWDTRHTWDLATWREEVEGELNEK